MERPIRAGFIPYLIGLTGFRLSSEWLLGGRNGCVGAIGMVMWGYYWLLRAIINRCTTSVTKAYLELFYLLGKKQ